MAEINIEAEKERYTNQLNAFIAELQRLDRQRAELIQAIAERQGILAFIAEISEGKDEHKDDKLSK